MLSNYELRDSEHIAENETFRAGNIKRLKFYSRMTLNSLNGFVKSRAHFPLKLFSRMIIIRLFLFFSFNSDRADADYLSEAPWQHASAPSSLAVISVYGFRFQCQLTFT